MIPHINADVARKQAKFSRITFIERQIPDLIEAFYKNLNESINNGKNEVILRLCLNDKTISDVKLLCEFLDSKGFVVPTKSELVDIFVEFTDSFENNTFNLYVKY